MYGLRFILLRSSWRPSKRKASSSWLSCWPYPWNWGANFPSWYLKLEGETDAVSPCEHVMIKIRAQTKQAIGIKCYTHRHSVPTANSKLTAVGTWCLQLAHGACSSSCNIHSLPHGMPSKQAQATIAKTSTPWWQYCRSLLQDDNSRQDQLAEEVRLMRL